MRLIQYKLTTPVQPIFITASEHTVEAVSWRKGDAPVVAALDPSDPAQKTLRVAVRQIEEYFAGKRRDFDLPLNFKGTLFQEKVWRELCKITFGQTVSYSDIARRIKHPKAVRAVGNTNGRNPICVIIPCHRVIASGGGLGGYTGGLHIKRHLLALEEK